MVLKSILIVSFLTAVTLAQRPTPPTFSRASQGRFATPLELEPNQPVPQPFRRVSLPLYRGRGFSIDGQEPKPLPLVPQQTFQPRPSLTPIENNNGEFSRVGNIVPDSAAEIPPQPTRIQAPPFQPVEKTQQQQVEKTQQQQQVDRAERIQQQQVDRIQQQQQQIDRIQSQPEKQYPSFRPQPQIQSIEKQPQFVRKIVQRPSQKRVQVTEEAAVAASRTPEMVQKLKLERSESADKQRAKKPVSQVLRRYRDDNPDGSITWGFENDDGTFKQETIGVDCVTRGKYGYVDPEGVKREYEYQSGVPCDKNRQPLVQAGAQGQQQPSSSAAVQEAQASDSYGYIDYTRNQYVMANGQTIQLNGMAKNRARKPVARGKTAVASGGGPQPGNF